MAKPTAVPFLLAKTLVIYVEHIATAKRIFWLTALKLQSLLRALSSPLRASSYEPGNLAGSVTGTNSLWCVHMGNFSLVDQDDRPRNKTKMVEHKLILFATVRTLWTLVTLLIKLFCILPWSGNTYKSKLIPFWPLSGESEGILSKMFRPGHRAGVFIWENFNPGYRDLGNRASPAPHMNTSMFEQRKESRGEISENEPARLTGLIWRGP